MDYFILLNVVSINYFFGVTMPGSRENILKVWLYFQKVPAG